MTVNLAPFLKSLLSTPGLSGFEAPTRTRLETVWQPLCDELGASRLGSLHALKRGDAPEPRPRLLITAHMDTIGLLVSGVIDGLLRIAAVGGVDSRVLPGQPVIVHGRQELPGVVIQPPAFLLPAERKEGTLLLEDLLVDLALPPAQVKRLVRVGDPISFAQPPLELGAEKLAGPYLDNRASLAAITVCLQEMQSRRHAWDLWVVASVQEEETLGGALTSAFQLKPSLAVVLDVTFGAGPGSPAHKAFPLDKGVVLGWGPTIHPALFKAFKELAERCEIPSQTEVMPGLSSTDADSLQLAREGIPTMLLAIPLRYMHTAVELVSLKDIRRAGRLLAEFVASLTPDFLERLAWES